MPQLDRPLSGKREQFATRAAFLAAGLTASAWAPLAPYAKARVGVDAAGFGVLLLFLGLGSIVAMPITGALTSRFGCRAVIAVALLLIAATVPFLAIVDTPVALAIVLAVYGASIGVLGVGMNIQAIIVEQDSGRSMVSGFHALYSLGGMVGAGGVSVLLGAGLSPLGATIAVSAILLVVLTASFPGLLTYGSREQARTPLFVLPKGVLIAIGALCFAVFLSEGAVLDWSALFLISSHGMESSTAGLGYTMFAVTMTLGRFAGDWIVQTFGRAKVILFGGMISALGFCVAVLALNQIVALAGFALVGLGASNIVPVLVSAAGRQKIMPPGLAVASVSTMGYAGILLGPAGVGFVAQHSSLGFAMAMLGVIMAVVAAAGPMFVRK